VNVPGVRAFEQKGVTVATGKTLELNIKLEEGTQLSTLGEDPLAIAADRKLHHAPSGPTPRTGDGKPDLSGVWWSPVMTDPGKPEWLPGAQAIAKQRQDNNSIDSPQAQCLPPAVTRLGPLFALAQTKQLMVVISDDASPGFNQIHLDRSAHPKEPDMDLWYGDSIGHWEDDTLVVDSVGFTPDTSLGMNMVMRHSDKMHIVERFHLKDPKTLEITTTIDDPEALAKPFTRTTTYARHPDWTLAEYICQQNNRNFVDADGKPGINLKH
jgi:hypothetical protein